MGRGRRPLFPLLDQSRGGARVQRLPSRWGSRGMNGGAPWQRPPTLATSLRRGRRAQGQIGNRWGRRARPATLEQRERRREREGQTCPGAQSEAALRPGCGFENSTGEARNAEAQRDLRVSGTGREAGAGMETQGLPRLFPSLVKTPLFPASALRTTPERQRQRDVLSSQLSSAVLPQATGHGSRRQAHHHPHSAKNGAKKERQLPTARKSRDWN